MEPFTRDKSKWLEENQQKPQKAKAWEMSVYKGASLSYSQDANMVGHERISYKLGVEEESTPMLICC